MARLEPSGADDRNTGSDGSWRPRGTPARLIIVNSKGSGAPSGWAERLAAAWPDASALPDIELWSTDDLEARVSTSDGADAVFDDAGVVIVLDGAGASGRVSRFADVLERHAASVVFIAHDDAAAARAARSGMLSRRGMAAIGAGDWRGDGSDTGPDERAARAASVLHGMGQRQPMVRRVLNELRIVQRASDNVRGELDRLESELREAARMQQDFAHRGLPDVPGLDLRAVYRPAGHVSGDVFDVERLDESRVGIFLADAAGHGVPAAMLTLFISRALPKVERSGRAARIVPPGEALARLNHDFTSRGGPADRFATAVYAVYDAETRRMTVAGAGHPAPILAGAGVGDGMGHERVETDGPLLGVFPDATFAETTIELPPGRSLVLFSDGWEVAFPKPNADHHELRVPTQTYLDRLGTLGRACGKGEGERAIGDMLGMLDSQAGSLHQPDDVTALVITGAEAGEVKNAA